MYRLLPLVVFAYALLSAAAWNRASQWLYARPGVWWCGNVVGDPYMGLVNEVAPLAAVANAILIRRCVQSRRRRSGAIVSSLVFIVTSSCLIYEGYFLSHAYGFPLGNIWWLPWI